MAQAMTMHILSGGKLRLRKSLYYPEAGRDEHLDVPVISVLLRHSQSNILFDTGCHPSVETEAEKRWGGLARFMPPIAEPGDNLVAHLAETGLRPEDIDLVICSHLHPDHCGCNEYFTRATVLCHRAELAAARADPKGQQGYLSVDWDVGLPFDEVDGERDLFGDERIVLIPVPGHTPGSLAALVELDRSGQFLLASDAVPVLDVLQTGTIPRNTWNGERAAASYAVIRDLQKRGAQVVCGHDMAQWRRLKKGLDFYA